MVMERRQFDRRSFKAGVYCYVDGRRFDARCADVSGSGMFLALEEDVPKGLLIAMVFKSKKGRKVRTEDGIKFVSGIGGEPVYLVGRVVRRQIRPVRGVGLEWVRAITDAPSEALVRFLRKLVGIDASNDIHQAIGKDGKTRRSTFEFGPFLEELARQESTDQYDLTGMEALGGEVAESAADLYLGDGESFDVEMDEDGPELPREHYRHGGAHRAAAGVDTGPITSRMHRTERLVPAKGNALFHIGELQVPVRIGAIGGQGLFVHSPVVPTNRSQPYWLVVEVASRQGARKVRVKSRVVGVDDGSSSGTPGVYLEFLEFYDEDEQKVLEEYVRYLHFRSLSE